jgi:putative transcriptional regulator
VRSKTFKSDVLAAIHETASDLSDAGLLDKRTLREFDQLCLTPVTPLSPDEIKEIRLNARVSQSVFAHYLNVSPGVVSQWERGEKHPAGASLKLLVIVRKKGLEAIA